MANRSEKLVAFHGGLNDNSDAKDIAEDELSSAVDCSVSRVGRIGIIGGGDTSLTNLDGASINPVKDYGMFYFSSDRDKDGKQLSEDWLALYDSEDGRVQFYYRDKQGSTPNISTIYDEFVESGKKATAKPSFYIADGILRYSNGDFSAATSNRVHQYIDKGFFEKSSVTAHLDTTGTWGTTNSTVSALNSTTGLTVGDIAEGTGIPKNTTVLSIDGSTCVLSNVPTTIQSSATQITFKNPAIVTRQGWVNSDQELKSFDDLGKTLAIDKSDAEGPDDTALGDSIGKIILSYWVSDDGKWNGSFQFAASPIYHQGGVGPISEFGTTINFHENKVSFQLHISRTNSSSESSTAHPFGDDRIVGVRVFFRSHGADKWHKLKDFDMLKGGKFNWDTYDGDTNKDYGIFDGSISDVALSNSTLTNYARSCSYNNSSSTITHTADNNVVLGLTVTGTDIPSNTTITAINSPTSFSIAPKQTTGSSSSATLTFNDLPAQIKSFQTTNATFTVTNSASGFDNRYGFLRLWGPHNEPIWKNLNDNGTPIALTTANHSISITTPAEGKREFQVELLDETFNVVAQSSKAKITISDSGNSPPPDYSDDTGSS